MDWATIIPLIVAVAGLSVSALTLLRQKRKDDVEIAGTIAEMAVDQLEPLKSRISDLEGQVGALAGDNRRLKESTEILQKEHETLSKDNRRLMRENDELWRGVLLLLKQLANEGLEPNWTPTDRILTRYGFKPGDFGRKSNGQ